MIVLELTAPFCANGELVGLYTTGFDGHVLIGSLLFAVYVFNNEAALPGLTDALPFSK